MASEIARLINCGEVDSDNINSLLEEYLYKSDDESDSDTDSDVCNGASSDENDEIDERRNGYDDAVALTKRSSRIPPTRNLPRSVALGMYVQTYSYCIKVYTIMIKSVISV